MSRRKKYTIEEVKEYITSRGGKCLSDIYIHNKSKMKYICDRCEHIWESSFKEVKILGNWCPKCSGRLNNNIETVHKLAIERDGKCLSTVYQNNKTNLTWQCNKCQKIWDARLDRIKSGTWCPKCRRSHGEKAIAKYLDSIDISYKEEYILRDGTNKRFDFYIDKYNLAIEFDGVQHFQIYRKYCPDEKTLEKNKRYDLEKVVYCLTNKIRILRISYDTTNICGIIDYALQSTFPILVTGFKYEHIIKDIDSEKVRVLLNGGR